MSEGIDVRVENRLIRFVPASPVDQGRVEAELGGVRAGDLVIVVLSRPSATVIVDVEGRLIVHGTHRVEAAQAAAKEVLLRLGAADASLSMEFGPIIASFQYRRAVDIHRLAGDLGAGQGEVDERLGCVCINDERHGMTIHLWSNGKAVATEARHPNMVAMAAVHWRTQIESRQAFVSGA